MRHPFLIVVLALALPGAVPAARPGTRRGGSHGSAGGGGVAPLLGTIALRPVGTLDVAAASGLLVGRQGLRVVADDQTTLTHASRRGVARGRLALVDDVLPSEHRALKAAKPDFEALADVPGLGALAIGSGSTPARDRAVLIQGARTTPVDLAPLYGTLRARFGDLNVEGAGVVGDRLALATRRSGSSGANRLVLLDLARTRRALRSRSPRLGGDLIVDVLPVDLGTLDGVPLGLTDLAPWKGGLLFAAAAEKTDDPVEDGVCVGSCVGWMDPSGRVRASYAVSPRGIKLEGIAARGHRLVAVTDADDPTRMSPVLEAPLPPALLDPR